MRSERDIAMSGNNIYIIQMEGDDDFLCDEDGNVLFFDDLVQLSSYVTQEGLDQDKVIVVETYSGYNIDD